MDPTPRRLRITLAHLDRRSMLIVSLQLALGAAAIMGLGLSIRWLIEGSPIASGPGLGKSPLVESAALVALFAVGMFLINFAGACLFRIFYWLRRRISPRR